MRNAKNAMRGLDTWYEVEVDIFKIETNKWVKYADSKRAKDAIVRNASQDAEILQLKVIEL